MKVLVEVSICFGALVFAAAIASFDTYLSVRALKKRGIIAPITSESKNGIR